MSVSSSAYAQCTGPVLGPLGSLGSVANAVVSTIGTTNTAFLAQGTAFVGSPTSSVPNQIGGGVWARGIGGQITADSVGTGTSTSGGEPVSATCDSSIRQNFAGVQVGADLGKLNVGNSGANVHWGITAGYVELNAKDRSGGDFSGKFEVPFVGVYTTYTQGNFFADFQARLDFYHMNLTSPLAQLANQGVDARGVSFIGSAGYRFDIPNGNGWFIEPSVGLIYSKTYVNPINTVGFFDGAYADINDITSTLGRAGVRVGTSFVSGNLALQPFATASVWHEFAGAVTSQFVDQTFLTQAQLSTSRVGTYGQYSAGIAGQLIDTGWLGYVRFDYRSGSNIEGWSMNGGLRYQLQPGPAQVAAPGIVTKAPVAPRVGIYNWSGLYIGGYLGTLWGSTDWAWLNSADEVSKPRLQGLIGGGQVGYNFQAGSWVLGAEADIGVSNARGSHSESGLFNDSFTDNVKRTSPLATLTGRLGYAWDRVLGYVKGGAAWTRSSYSATTNFGGGEAFTATDNRTGWVVGAGMELGLAPNWSAKVEYNHADFGTRDVNFDPSFTIRIDKSVDIIKVGLNYRFAQQPIAAVDAPVSPLAAGMPVKAPPAPVVSVTQWLGCYVGVEGGGAWGRSRVDTTGGDLGIPPLSDLVSLTGNFNVNGVLVGGTVGCNLLEANNWVFGAEGDLSWTNKEGSANNNNPSFDSNAVNEVRENWLATIRGRVGYVVTKDWLLFATAGLAVAEVRYSLSNPTVPGLGVLSEVHTRSGWTVGGGAEWKFAQNWSLKGEYLYVDFGGFPYMDPAPLNPVAIIANRAGGVFLNNHIVRGGLNYRFF